MNQEWDLSEFLTEILKRCKISTFMGISVGYSFTAMKGLENPECRYFWTSAHAAKIQKTVTNHEQAFNWIATLKSEDIAPNAEQLFEHEFGFLMESGWRLGTILTCTIWLTK